MSESGVDHPLEAGTSVRYDHYLDTLGRGEVVGSYESETGLMYRIKEPDHPVPARIPADSVAEVLD